MKNLHFRALCSGSWLLLRERWLIVFDTWPEPASTHSSLIKQPPSLSDQIMKEFTSQQFQNQKQLLQRSRTILDGGTRPAFAEGDKELRKHLNSVRAMSFTIAHKTISNRNIGSEPLDRRLSSHYKFGSRGSSRILRARSRSPEDKISSLSEPETSTSTEDERIRMTPVLNKRLRGKDSILKMIVQ